MLLTTSALPSFGRPPSFRPKLASAVFRRSFRERGRTREIYLARRVPLPWSMQVVPERLDNWSLRRAYGPRAAPLFARPRAPPGHCMPGTDDHNNGCGRRGARLETWTPATCGRWCPVLAIFARRRPLIAPRWARVGTLYMYDNLSSALREKAEAPTASTRAKHCVRADLAPFGRT